MSSLVYSTAKCHAVQSKRKRRTRIGQKPANLTVLQSIAYDIKQLNSAK